MSKESINGVDFSSGLSAIIRSKSTNEGREFAQAFVDVGVDLIEFTTTTPGAFDLIEEFSGIKNVQIALGTAMSKQDVENGKKAGFSKFKEKYKQYQDAELNVEKIQKQALESAEKTIFKAKIEEEPE